MRLFSAFLLSLSFLTPSTLVWAQEASSSLYNQRMAEAMAQGIEKRYRSDDNVKAISYSIGAHPYILKFGNQGEARSSQDPGGVVLMKDHPTHLITVGSISKSLAALGLMNYAESHSEVDLDAPIEPYLPQKILSFVHPSIKTMTLRQLMSHTSGFRALNYSDFQSDLAYSGAQIYDHSIWRNLYYLRLGVQAENVGKYSYSNMNYALISYFFARIAYPLEAQHLEDSVPYTGDPYVYFDELNKLWRPYFRQYVREHVLNPADVDGDCFYPDDDPQPVLYYTTPQSTLGHLLYDKTTEKYEGGEPGDETLTCGPGGWKLSMEDLTKVMTTFASTQEIVLNASRNEIYQDRLGMFPISSKRGTAYFHNGSAGSQLNAYDIFPDGLVASLAITSTHCKTLQNGVCLEAYYDYPQNGLRDVYNEAYTEMQSPVCGNQILSVLEECDDGNSDNSDACLNDCRLAFCGDGFVRQGIESCDEGALNGQAGHCNDACSGQAVFCGAQVLQNAEDCVEVPGDEPEVPTSPPQEESPVSEEPVQDPVDAPIQAAPSAPSAENPEEASQGSPGSFEAQTPGSCAIQAGSSGFNFLHGSYLFAPLLLILKLRDRSDKLSPQSRVSDL